LASNALVQDMTIVGVLASSVLAQDATIVGIGKQCTGMRHDYSGYWQAMR